MLSKNKGRKHFARFGSAAAVVEGKGRDGAPTARERELPDASIKPSVSPFLSLWFFMVTLVCLHDKPDTMHHWLLDAD